MTPQYPSLVFYDNGCMVGWMHECLKIGMYHLIPSVRSSSLEQIINGILREIFTPAIPSPFPPSPFPCLYIYIYIYIDLSVNVYHSGPLEKVIYSLSLVYHKRGEDTWTSQDKMVYTLYLLSTYTFLGSSHLSSYLLPFFYIYYLN